jgi:protein involved in polysaccharide export with SLBB domain
MKAVRLFVLLIFALIQFNTYSQSVSDLPEDLSTFNVDDLSDDQIRQLIKRMDEGGYTTDQFETAALARGMSSAEFQKLKYRIEKVRSESGTTSEKESFQNRSRKSKYNTEKDVDKKGSINKGVTDKDREYESQQKKTEEDEFEDDIFSDLTKKEKKKKPVKPEDMIFGAKLFKNKELSFEPSLSIPTPANYVLAAGDEIIIDIWGASEQTYNQEITPEGAVIIKNLGPVYLNGLTIEEATKKLRKELSRIYSGLSGSGTYLKVSLGSVRSIKVNIVGEATNPGTYTLPSLATVFNALYAAGGPSLNGTLRDIRLIRNGVTVDTLDLYNFLLKGEQKENVRLDDQDVIFISPYVARAEVKGEVKRPLIYEVRKGETLSDLINFSGGYTGKAYTSLVKMYRKNGRENKILDVRSEVFDTVKIFNGDEILVDSILNRFENLVEIKGAVYRPGQFSIVDTLTLKELIKKSDGLRGDAFMNRAVIYRTKEDYTMDVIPVDLKKLFQSENDIPLVREDLVVIPSIFDLREEYTIEVDGEVQKPGTYPYVSNTSIEDVIIQAGGLLESASYARLEVARRIRNNVATTSSNQIAEVFQFPISQDLQLSDSASRFVLQPFDQVFIRRSPGYEVQSIVKVEGEVAFPGNYSISNKSERISDLVKRSGGLTFEAYPEGARLIRKLPIDEKERKKALAAIKASFNKDSANFVVELDSVSAIGINLDKILAQPKSKYDLILQKGDILRVPKELQVVRLSGAVLSPVLVRYDRPKFKDYISSAGGFAPEARRRSSYIIYANGNINRTRKFLFFNNYPKVEPGAEIIVPKKPDKPGLGAGEAVSIATGLATLSYLLVTIINATK